MVILFAMVLTTRIRLRTVVASALTPREWRYKNIVIKDGKNHNHEAKRKRRNRLSSLTIVVIRVGTDHMLLNSRPCSQCILHMRSVGVRKVIYSIEGHGLVCENVNKMETTHLTLGRRKLLESYRRR